jgi:hypothetical protein
MVRTRNSRSGHVQDRPNYDCPNYGCRITGDGALKYSSAVRSSCSWTASRRAMSIECAVTASLLPQVCHRNCGNLASPGAFMPHDCPQNVLGRYGRYGHLSGPGRVRSRRILWRRTHRKRRSDRAKRTDGSPSNIAVRHDGVGHQRQKWQICCRANYRSWPIWPWSHHRSKPCRRG